jgi:Uma2 family endonuclease
MGAIVVADTVRIPDSVRDLESFRRWACSEDFPEQGWFSYLNGELWVDPSMENLAHNKVKGQICSVLTLLVESAGSGQFLHDRMLLTNTSAELSTEPDGMFLSLDATDSGRVVLREGDDSLEVEGTPDMVLEVVSPTSVRKDTVVLRDLYWKAGVQEYWLVHPRGEELRFDLLRHASKGYSASPRRGGWLKSSVFGKSFRLTRNTDARNLGVYKLEVR